MKPLSTNKKIILLIGIIILLTILTFTSVIQTSKTKDIILKKDLTCEFRQEIYVTDFVAKINGTIINNPKINTDKIGSQTISLTYKTKYGLILTKRFEIEVKDVTAPTVIVSNPYTLEKGSVTSLIDTIFCADDYDDNVNCTITGTYDLNKLGKYNLTITATDHSNNSTSKDFTLNIIEKQKNTTQPQEEFTDFKTIYQKYKTKNTLIGLDLSKWQGDVDFEEIKNQGVTFVMLKLGGQTEINGEYHLDPKFHDNITSAIEHRLKVGVYFYSYANSEKEARNQAKWIVSNIKDYPIDLPIVFDWENWSKYTTFHLSFHSLNKIATAFMEEIKTTEYTPMLYASKYYLETIWYADNYTNWLAYYTSNNDYEKDYYMWQVCNNGKINGIDGYVDIDVLYLS